MTKIKRGATLPKLQLFKAIQTAADAAIAAVNILPAKNFSHSIVVLQQWLPELLNVAVSDTTGGDAVMEMTK